MWLLGYNSSNNSNANGKEITAFVDQKDVIIPPISPITETPTNPLSTSSSSSTTPIPTPTTSSQTYGPLPDIENILNKTPFPSASEFEKIKKSRFGENTAILENYLNGQVIQKLQSPLHLQTISDTAITIKISLIPGIDSLEDLQIITNNFLSFNADYCRCFRNNFDTQTVYSFHLMVKMYAEMILKKIMNTNQTEFTLRGTIVLFDHECASMHNRIYESLKKFILNQSGYTVWPLENYTGIIISPHTSITNEDGEFVYFPYRHYPRTLKPIDKFYVLNNVHQPVLFYKVNEQDLKPEMEVLANYKESIGLYRGVVKLITFPSSQNIPSSQTLMINFSDGDKCLLSESNIFYALYNQGKNGDFTILSLRPL